jgi:hypothetical protein
VASPEMVVVPCPVLSGFMDSTGFYPVCLSSEFHLHGFQDLTKKAMQPGMFITF